VFTPTATGQATCSFVAHNAIYLYQPSVYNTPFPTIELTERTVQTGMKEFEMAESYGLTAYDYVPIPTNSNDWGIITFITDDGTYIAGYSTYKIRVTMVAEDGTQTTNNLAITGAAGQITHVGCYPLNLQLAQAGAPFIQPASFPNYRYYTVSIHDASEPAEPRIGNLYVFFNKDYQCKSEPSGYKYMRLGWVNDLGGWDYFNFNYLAQYTQRTERKRMRAIVGEYTGTDYTVNVYDRGIKELSVFAERTLTMTSKPLDIFEWRLMSSLIRSKDVYIIGAPIDVQGLTTLTPVVIETNDNVEHRPLDSRLRSITLLAREAHPVV
jgi:hypothetical protein